MPKLLRRGSCPQPVIPNTWMEVAAPIVSRLLASETHHSHNREFWLTWSLVCRSWHDVVSTSRDLMAERLICDSSMRLRFVLWRRFLSVPEPVDQAEFTTLLLEGSYASWAEISRDSRRTYAPILRKRPDLHLQLTRILHALATRFRDVGYCQGMNSVAGTVLLALTSIADPGVLIAPSRNPGDEDDVANQSPSNANRASAPDTFIAVIQGSSTTMDEVLAFKICERIFLRNHFVRMYELGLHTRLNIWTFDKLVESLFPDLHDVITNELQVSADFYASSWFITLFSADLDFDCSVRILDLFIAKGIKSLHRFGLACIATEMPRLMRDEVINDPAEGLKALRGVAVGAVKQVGIEALIHRSVTEFKCVNNRLIADLQTTGKVHGGAQLMFITDKNSQRRSWLVVPMPTRDIAADGGDSSPSGAAFEAEWNKEEAAIRAGLDLNKSAALPNGSSKMAQLLGRMRFRRASLEKATSQDASHEATGVGSIAAPTVEGDDANDDADMMLTGRRQSTSPEHREQRRSSKREKATNALRSFRRKLGSIIPHSSSKGYSRSGFGGAPTDE